MKRPTFSNPAVVKRAAEAVSDKVLAWTGTRPGTPEAQVILGELRVAVENSAPSYDAYDVARLLEDMYGWSPNSKLVEALGGSRPAARNTLRRFEEVWVRRHGLRPEYHVGSIVAFRTGDNATFHGEVTDIDPRRGYYHVNSPELGHVGADERGVHGVLVPYENVHMALRPEEPCGNTPAC